jgi:hypothetical protein
LTHSPPEVSTDLSRPEKISFLRYSHISKIQRSKPFSRIMTFHYFLFPTTKYRGRDESVAYFCLDEEEEDTTGIAKH